MDQSGVISSIGVRMPESRRQPQKSGCGDPGGWGSLAAGTGARPAFFSAMGKHMKQWLLAGAFALTMGSGAVLAQDVEEESTESAEAAAFFNSLKFRTGRIAIPEADATLNVTDGFKYLGHDDTRKVLEDLWGNPPDDEVIGLIVPDDADLKSDHSWAVLVTYSDEGYVSDSDAAEIDYDELLEQMKDETKEENDARVDEGYEGIALVGWARPPMYDKASKRLHWAKELAFSETEGHTLNYDIRVLGRSGFLNLNAIAAMSDFDRVNRGMDKVLPMAEFDAGHRYADYTSGDKTAAYGLAALVTGGVLAKTGFFAKIGALLFAAKKLVVLGLAAIGGLFAKIFGKKKDGGTVQ
jgi:uncharacterized membrane-anchored protein